MKSLLYYHGCLFIGPLESDLVHAGANGNSFIDFGEFQAGFQMATFFSYLTHISWNNIDVYKFTQWIRDDPRPEKFTKSLSI